MNVQEQLLQETVDPGLSNAALTEAVRRALPALMETADVAAHSLRPGRVGGVGAPIVRGYHVLTGGCWNRVIGIDAGGRELVCKISPHGNDEKIIREFGVLTAFAERSHLPIPQPLYLDAEGEVLPGTSFLMTRIPGAVMHECFGMLNYGQRRGITRQIADDLASLHQIRSRGFGGVELDEDEREEHWADFWLPRFDRVIEEASAAGVPAELIEGAHEVRPHLRPLLEIGRESTMTHYDVWSGNVMLDVESSPPRVSGYIDIPGFFADYARELSFAMLFGVANRRFFETYLQTHELDDEFPIRAHVYNLKMNIKHIQMYPTQYAYQAGAMQDLQAIRDAIQ